MEENGEPDWYLQEWLRHFNKRQSDLVNELDYPKYSAFKIWHSRQPYGRKQVNEIARWLGIEPYELLMPPREALALRRLRESARAIAEDLAREETREPPPPTTNGKS